MTIQSSRTYGIDETLEASPPLVAAPLSLFDLCLNLWDNEQVASERQQALEQLVSAQGQLDKLAGVESAAAQDDDPAALMEAQAAVEKQQTEIAELEAWATTLMKQLGRQQAWERGFEYLPELTNPESMQVVQPDAAAAATDTGTKSTSATNNNRFWCDPFQVIAHDDRSLFGWPATDFDNRMQRALRALGMHGVWQAEKEWWTGQQIPTNYHLTASPSTPTTGAHRTIPAWTNPDAAPTTTLGTAVGLGQSLAALDQAIANGSGGTGMIHASPFVVQRWMAIYPYIRDSAGRVYTVNMNLIVPGYGYPGTGPDQTRSAADGVTNSTTTVTSATLAFTQLDVGQGIAGAGIPAGAYIVSVTNGTTVVISAAATATATGVTLTIGPGGSLVNSTKQWAYATERVYLGRGANVTYPWDLRQGAPEVPVQDSVDVRAEAAIALVTNHLVRAAVYVDTATS